MYIYIFLLLLNHALRHDTSLNDHSRTTTEPATLLTNGESARLGPGFGCIRLLSNLPDTPRLKPKY